MKFFIKLIALFYLLLSICIAFLCNGIHLIFLMILGGVLPFLLLRYKGSKKEEFFAWGIIVYFCITFFSTFAYMMFGPQNEQAAALFFSGLFWTTTYVIYPITIWKNYCSKNS